MKKNCLYTINPWNGNLFDIGGLVDTSATLTIPKTNFYTSFGHQTPRDYLSSTNLLGISKAENPFSKFNISGGIGQMAKTGIGSGLLSGLSGAVSTGAQKLISGGLNSGAGNAVGNLGRGVGSLVSQVNPLLGTVINVGSGILGGGINALVGTKTDQKALARANEALSSLTNFTSNANNFDDVRTHGTFANIGNVYKGGLLKKGWASNQNQELKDAITDAYAFADRSTDNNIYNIAHDQINDYLANYSAFGGPLGMAVAQPYTGLGAVGIMQQDKYISAINNRTDALAKNNNTTGSFGAIANRFADGGGIHIKPSHRGLFTEKADRAGMGVQAYASHVLANKEDYPTSTIRQANFAKNASGWKHDAGGELGAAFMDSFAQDPIAAAMQYKQGLQNLAAQQEAAEEAAAQQAAYDDLQKRVAAAETRNQGLQALLDNQGLTIQAMMENQPTYKPASGLNFSAQSPSDNMSTRKLRQALADRGIKKTAHQDAIIANIMVESGGDINAKNKNSSARGLLQWLKDRHPKAWDFDSQMDYIASTYNQFGGNNWLDKKAWERFNNTNDSIEAARLFRQYYERPEAHTYKWTDKHINQMYNRKAFGGELGTNGTDFTNGLLEVNAGGSHEDNPFEGVQLGLDPNGIPNLVEEGETVYNDYVFSKRMNVPAFMRKELGLGGSLKKDITFAEASKKLAEASKERPNSPIDQAGLDAALGKLAEIQETERVRMQAEEANAQMELQNAAMDAAMGAPTNEEMAMMGMMPEEAIAEQQPAENMMGLNPEGYAYGGNLFVTGGEKEALNWVNNKFPNAKNKQAVARALWKKANSNKGLYYRPEVRMFGKSDPNPRWDFDTVYSSMIPTVQANSERYFNEWMNNGLSADDAYLMINRGEKPKSQDLLYDWNKQKERFIANRNAAVNSRKAANSSSTRAANNQQFQGPARQNYFNADGTPTWNNSPYNTNTSAQVEQPQRVAAQRDSKGTVTKYNWKDLEGNSHATRKEAVEANIQYYANRARATQAPQAPAASTIPSNTSAAAPVAPTARRVAAPVRNTAVTPNRGDIVGYKYDWYRNGDDGTGNHWGFTPDENGIIDKNTGYTDDYRNLVSTLTADDIRAWAAAHPNDPSLQSFLRNNGPDALKNLTTEQWRAGATDGKYGFMHHVAAQIGNPDMMTPEEAAQALQVATRQTPQGTVNNGRVHHAVVGDDDYLQGDPSTWQGVGREIRRETLPNGDTVIYHEAGSPADVNTAVDSNTGELSPYPTWMRYAPAVGAGIFSLTDALGLTNKPDYTYANKLEAAATRAGYAPNIQAPHIGDYMRYNPLDRLFYANQMQANSRATDRGLMNISANNRGTAMAGMLANNYSTQQGLGNLDRQAEEYNRAQYERKKEYDRRTNMFNAQMGLEADMANARYRQQARQFELSGLAQAAAMRDAIDQRVGAARSANITNLLTSLGNIGRENFAMNQINSDKGWNYGVRRNGWSTWKGTNTASKGGKLRKKK